MQPCRHILALDPGGSKCDAVLLDDRGVIQGVGRASRPGQSGRSVAVMAAAARAALGTTALNELHCVSVSTHHRTPRRVARLRSGTIARPPAL